MSKTRIHKYYKNVVAEDLLILLNYQNIMQLPQIQHAVISNTDSDYLINKKQGVSAFAALSLLTGQKSIPTRAHKSIAAFKLRQGSFLGCKVTVRKKALDALLDQLVSFIFVYTQNYRFTITKNRKGRSSLNMGIHKIVALPLLEKFFIFFESLKGCNISFVLFCPILRNPSIITNSNSNSHTRIVSIPAYFLSCFQIPQSKT